MTSVTVGLGNVRARIESAARRFGRDPDEIRLVAVSKTHPVAAIRAAVAAAQYDFGENYLQDALPKIDVLADAGCCWHFIGAIQSNKTRPIAERFDWVHTVDRLRIARRLAQHRPGDRAPLNVCIQVAMSDTAGRAGVDSDAVAELAREIDVLDGLRLRGLMCLPEPEPDFDRQRVPFRQLAELKARLVAAGHALDTLSMGMTGDLEAAIAEGATMVRVGTAIFGPRLR